jgi:hypothetical protein
MFQIMILLINFYYQFTLLIDFNLLILVASKETVL